MAVSSSGTLTSTGVGSGIDVEAIVSKLMSVEQVPITQLDTKTTALQAKISAYGSLKSALATFQSSAAALSLPTKFNAFTSTVSSPDSLKASAFSTASTGQHSVVIKQLAAAHTVASNGVASVDSVVGSGTITIQFGSVTNGVFAADTSRAAQSIAIGNDQRTLSGIRDAIQAANVGVNATVLNDGSANGWRLGLSSTLTGVSSVMKITVSGDSDGNNSNASGLSSLVFDPATAGTKNMTQTVAASNALLKVDGLDNISKASNQVSDVIKGVTLDLQKEDPSATITVGVSRDVTSVSKSVQTFVDSYNTLQKAITDATAYDAVNSKASVLTGDSAARGIQSQVRAVLASTVAATPNGLTNLSQIGISFSRDGSLAFDTAKFTTAATSYPSDIGALFAGSADVKGFGAKLNDLIVSLTSDSGRIGSRVTGLNTSIAQLAQQKSRLTGRLSTIENRYRAQFNAMDALIASMKQTSAFLTQQLSALSTNTK